MNRILSRRMFLHGASGLALALPLLDNIPKAHAQAKSAADAGALTGDAGLPGGPIKRLIVLYSPNGTIPSAWMSTGAGASFAPAEIFSAPATPYNGSAPGMSGMYTGLVAAGHQSDLTLVHNLDMSVALDGPGGDAHGLGIGCMLTGLELSAGNMFQAGMGGPGSGWPSGQSIDQFIASQMPLTQRRSVDFAIKRMAGSIWSRMSYTGPDGETVEPFDDPTVAFSTLFANVGMSGSSVALQTSRRKSVLDEVTGELTALSASLSGNDRTKVENHLTMVRQMELQLGVATSLGCTKPPEPNLTASAPVLYNASGMEVKQDPSADADVPLRNQLAQQMLVASMACDIARVGTIMMAPSRSDIFLTWVPGGTTTSHHDLSHEDDTNPDGSATAAQLKLIQINQWYASQVAQVITALKAAPEGTGTMFDNTVILWCNELGIGNIHSHTNIPILLAGSAGGYFKTGQAVTMPAGTPHNRLLLSLCRAMGLSTTVFGNPKFCSDGPIAEIAA
jgi:uncharacterized protein DUF1552